MSASAQTHDRAPAFRRNASLEGLLSTLNSCLACSEQAALVHFATDLEDYPIVFVMGPHRSGTTLFMQWLANTGVVGYPTNLLSRFFGAPVIGAQIQLLLTDPRYNFRNEIHEFSGAVSYDSDVGKTTGALAPNEFWHFWRRFLPFGRLDWLPDEQLMERVDRKSLVAELTGLTRVLGKPFALKSMILNYNIPFLDAIFAKALFVQIRREPVANVASILEARKRYCGNEDGWHSFKIREYPQLKDLDPITQAAGQVYYVNRAVTEGMAVVDESRKLLVAYEEFCKDPCAVFDRLIEKLRIDRSVARARGAEQFSATRSADVPRRAAIESALTEFERSFGAPLTIPPQDAPAKPARGIATTDAFIAAINGRRHDAKQSGRKRT